MIRKQPRRVPITIEQRKIAHNIEICSRRMYYHKSKYQDYDIKRTALRSLLDKELAKNEFKEV